MGAILESLYEISPVLMLAAMVAFAVCMMYGFHRAWLVIASRFGRGLDQGNAALIALALAAATFLSPVAAHAQSFDVDVDLSSFFDSMNTFLPTMLSIFGLIGGIIGAIALAQMVIDRIIGAFR